MSEVVEKQAPSAADYSADSIQVLEGLEAVRKRPSMYIGDTGIKGLHHLVWEVVDNSIDEALAGHCDLIQVTINENNSVTVRDNGRGIPVDWHAKEGRSALEVVLTVLHAGGKFDKDSYKVSGGLHGVGVSCVNALSIDLKVTVRRKGHVYEQEYSIGAPLYPVKEIGDTDEHGTEVQFLPDPSIFADTEYRYATIASRLRDLSFLNKGIRITLTDRRDVLTGDAAVGHVDADGFRYEEFYSTGGLRDFVQYLDGTERPSLLAEPIYVESEKGGMPVEVALQYNTSYQENVYSYVNNINTYEGGTHVAGFRSAVTRVLKNYGDKKQLFEKAKVDITGDDFREGLTAVISVKVQEPQFEGQTKTKLGNSEVSGAVNSAVGEILAQYLEENPGQANRIMEKVILAAKARIAARKAKDMVQRKNVLGSNSLPGKLADCSDSDPEACELYLVEGDSAGGTAKMGRNRAFQAILPLRGKILNVEKAQEHKILENEEIKNMITALGVTFNERKSLAFGTDDDGNETGPLNFDKLRYHKVIIMTDADIDGSHIRTLILTFFFRYMRQLVDQGHIYIALPPLYLVKRGKEERYCWSEEDRVAATEEIGRGKPETVNVQRYKGLGEMNAEQLWTTTMQPATRSLKRVTVDSAAEADHLFSMLMGDEVAPRRDFIEQNAKYAKLDV